MATFSGNAEFFDIVSQVENIKKDIVGKEAAIEKIKLEYGIEDFDLSKSENKVSEKNIDVDIGD